MSPRDDARPARCAPRPAAPAAPCTATPHAAASNGGAPAARKAPITPASTSPLPAVASAGEATLERSTSPPGRGDHRVGTLEHDDLVPALGGIGGRRRARASSSSTAGASPPMSRANSPGCGVSTSSSRERPATSGRLGGQGIQPVGVDHGRRAQPAIRLRACVAASPAGGRGPGRSRARRKRPPRAVARRQPLGAMRPGASSSSDHPGQLGHRAGQATAPPTRPPRPGPCRRRRASRRARQAAPRRDTPPSRRPPARRPKSPLWARSGRAGRRSRHPALRSASGPAARSCGSPRQVWRRWATATATAMRRSCEIETLTSSRSIASARRAARVVQVDLRRAGAVRQDLDLAPPDAAHAEPEHLADRLLRRPAAGDALHAAAAVALLVLGQHAQPEAVREAGRARRWMRSMSMRSMPISWRLILGVMPRRYSTVTDLARLRGWSTSVPRATATS